MLNIHDLHIETEVLPLLDYTHTTLAQQALVDLLKEPPLHLAEIQLRQQILKGFIANQECIKSFAYSRIDLLEVYEFTRYFNKSEMSGVEFMIRLSINGYVRQQKRSRLVQLVLLLCKLQNAYFLRTNAALFPACYQVQLQRIGEFLDSMRLSYYADLIKEEKFGIRHIIELTDTIAELTESKKFEAFWKECFLFEAYLSLGIAMQKHGFVFPEFTKDAFLLKQFYHPALANPVKNDFSTNSNVILLTGANMSGKSTFLKAVSLCVYLGHLGLGVPAAKAAIPYFNSISVGINLNDNIASGYSHFMTEVLNLKAIVSEAAAHKTCFAVFDELFRGTNIDDAVDISTTTIKGLTRYKNCLFFISTHLEQLKYLEEIQNNKVSAYYIECELEGNRPTFTYTLKQGWSDVKIGRILFDREGLNTYLG
jgi:DNA mismatch repair protein MutS